ncbi:MAG: hypothetical protein IPM51_11070 [Sphingobacteriaceae bacterium]|nr:hypothetical protein [Sphingobacteriaceae bacterium]
MRILFIFFFLALQLKSQQIQVINGEEFSTPSKTEDDFYIKGDTSAFFIINNKNNIKQGHCFLSKITYSTQAPVYTREIFYRDNWKTQLLFANYVNNKIALYLEIKENDNKKAVLLKKYYSADYGIEINQEERLDSVLFDHAINHSVWKIISSESENVLYTIQSLHPKNEYDFKIASYATENSIRNWVYVETDSSRQSIRQWLGDDKGILYVLNTDKQNHFRLKICTGKKENDQQQLLPNAKKTIFEPVLKIINNQLYCTGEFIPGIGKNKEMNDLPVNGFFLLRYDANTLVLKDSCFDDLNQRLRNKLNYKYKNKTIKLEGPKNTLCASKNYVHHSLFSFKGSIYAIKFHAIFKNGKIAARNEIIVLKYTQGKPEWMQIIPGNNVLESKMGFEIVVAEKMHLFYFDRKDNIIHYPDIGFYAPKNYKSVMDNAAILVRIGIDERGIMERDNIYTYVDWDFNIYSDIQKLNSGNKIIITADKGKTRRFDQLILTE